MSSKKQRLFEVMGKVNPEFKNSNEAQAQATVEPLSTDVTNLQKAIKTSSSVRFADSKIDTPIEFQEGFKLWLSTTGFNPQKKPLSISQAQTLVKKAMESLGFR